MTELFRSGQVIDVILLVVVIEVALLMLLSELRGKMKRLDVLSLVLPGVMLMLALRSVLQTSPEIETAALLAAAFVFHLWDISRRRKAG